MSAIALNPSARSPRLGALVLFAIMVVGANLLRVGGGVLSSDAGGGDPPDASSACEGQSNLHYIRAAGGSYGSENGSDWDNAYDGVPATLQRNHSYYLGNGSMGGAYSWNDAPSSNQPIRICKASVTDHGTSTGWSDTFAQPATWSGQWTVSTDDWVFDGTYRDEDDWFDDSAYGFQILTPNAAGCTGSNTCFDQQLVIDGPDSARDNLTFEHIYLRGRDSLPPCCDGNADRIYAIDFGESFTVTHTNMVFSRVYVSGSNNVWFIRGTSGTIIEYSANDNALGDSDNHGEIVNLYYTAENAIVRFNIFKDAYLTAQGTALIAIQDTGGHKIYGNSFCNFETGDGVIGFIGGNGSNMEIYNNTAANGHGSSMAIRANSGSSNVARNNLLIGGSATKDISLGSGETVTHNGTSLSSGSGSNLQVNIPTSIFVDYDNCDLRLSTATTAGFTLSSPYNTDLLGVIRGADGTFDRGSYDYVQ